MQQGLLRCYYDAVVQPLHQHLRTALAVSAESKEKRFVIDDLRLLERHVLESNVCNLEFANALLGYLRKEMLFQDQFVPRLKIIVQYIWNHREVTAIRQFPHIDALFAWICPTHLILSYELVRIRSNGDVAWLVDRGCKLINAKKISFQEDENHLRTPKQKESSRSNSSVSISPPSATVVPCHQNHSPSQTTMLSRTVL